MYILASSPGSTQHFFNVFMRNVTCQYIVKSWAEPRDEATCVCVVNSQSLPAQFAFVLLPLDQRTLMEGTPPNAVKLKVCI